MAIIVYISGYTEELKPKNLVFTEQEIVDLFNDYPIIKTIRPVELLNTWCIFGAGKNNLTEYNEIASNIIKEDIYSHALFVHDSEINPEWNATDDIIYYSYDKHVENLKTIINSIAEKIMNRLTNSEEYIKSSKNLPILEDFGVTNEFPKRILFKFNPLKQSNTLYESKEFDTFSRKIYEYLTKNKPDFTKESFIIYADAKVIISIDNENVIYFLEKMINQFEREEEYEMCTYIKYLMDEWNKKIESHQNEKE